MEIDDLEIDDLEIYTKAIKKWGKAFQIIKLQEELLELATVISQMQVGHKSEYELYERFFDEIADVKILLNQMTLIFGKEKIRERMKFKLNRLNGILTNGKD